MTPSLLQPENGLQPPLHSHDRVNILLVDDRHANLLCLEAALAGLGQNLVRATSDREALKLLLDQEFAVILLDVEMPEMDVLETAALIRSREASRDTPILFITAHDPGAAVAFQGYAAGAVDYLSKPLIPEILRAKVSVFVDLARKTQALERAHAELERQAEAQLRESRESQEQFRLLVEGTKDYAIFMLDGQGRVASWNLGAALMYGYGAREAVGQHFSFLCLPEDAEGGGVEEELRTALREGRYRGEGWRVRKDGSRFWSSVVVTALYDPDSRLRGFGKVVRDMTAQKEAETALLETQALFRDFMIHSPALAFIRDSGGRLVYVNAAYERFFGASLGELKGKALHEVVPEATAAALRMLYQRVLTENRPFQEDHRIPSPAGQVHECRFHLFPITTAAGERLLGGFALDVSEQRFLEEQLRQAQKLEAIGLLAGGVAHDFNNMLAVINGYSDLLLARTDLDPKVCQGLEEILKAGERAASLTRQLLAFSRKQVLQPRRFDLKDLVADLQRLLGRLIGEDIQFATVAAEESCPVFLDPGEVEQILMNLVVNARDAMPRGGCLTIETRPVELDADYAAQHFDVVPGPYVRLTVTDTGCGMEKETLLRIFDPFFTTKDVGKGTGLGLSTVYGIVKQSGGDLQVHSEPKVGTTFSVYLPRVTDSGEGATRPKPFAAPLSMGTQTILVVEDEEMVRNFVCHALRLGGYTVLEATDAREALRVCGQYAASIDLLLTDVVMPTRSGRELAECLLPSRPGMQVLFMSGYTDDAVVRHGVLAAEAAFLPKPFSPGELTRKVREVLDRREGQCVSAL